MIDRIKGRKNNGRSFQTERIKKNAADQKQHIPIPHAIRQTFIQNGHTDNTGHQNDKHDHAKPV